MNDRESMFPDRAEMVINLFNAGHHDYKQIAEILNSEGFMVMFAGANVTESWVYEVVNDYMIDVAESVALRQVEDY